MAIKKFYACKINNVDKLRVNVEMATNFPNISIIQITNYLHFNSDTKWHHK